MTNPLFSNALSAVSQPQAISGSTAGAAVRPHARPEIAAHGGDRIAPARPQPSDLRAVAMTLGGVSNAAKGEAANAALPQRYRLNAEFGYVERFDERAARAIISSGDFQWDAVFLFPRQRQELDDVIAIPENVDVRCATFAATGEFIYSTGDGIGFRWIHPNPASDIERIKRVCAEQGFTLVSLDSSERGTST